MRSEPIDVMSWVDERPISLFQIGVFAVCFMLIMCDGFDTQSIAYVAPSLASQWKLPPGSFGSVFSAALLGSMAGALGFGYLADRIGRKRTLAICAVLFGVLNIASAYATSIGTFSLLRFACGIGLGGAIPNVMALVSEYAPARKRATIVAIIWWGFALGAVFGGLLSVAMISHFGWEAVFILGGIIPLVMAPIILVALPESLAFLMLSRENGAKVSSILTKIDPSFAASGPRSFVLYGERASRSPISSLFTEGNAVGSIFLCLALFMSLVLVYCLINWIPLLLRQVGLPLEDALMGTVIFNLSGIVGSFVCTQVIDRSGGRHAVAVLCAAYFCGAFAVLSIGWAGNSFWPIMTTIFISGFFMIGVQLSLNAFITNYYPTSIRGTGVGWSQFVGRTGSLVGPLVGGALVSQGIGPHQLFQLSSLAPLLACLSLLIFWRLSSPARRIRPA